MVRAQDLRNLTNIIGYTLLVLFRCSVKSAPEGHLYAARSLRERIKNLFDLDIEKPLYYPIVPARKCFEFVSLKLSKNSSYGSKIMKILICLYELATPEAKGVLKDGCMLSFLGNGLHGPIWLHKAAKHLSLSYDQLLSYFGFQAFQQSLNQMEQMNPLLQKGSSMWLFFS